MCKKNVRSLLQHIKAILCILFQAQYGQHCNCTLADGAGSALSAIGCTRCTQSAKNALSTLLLRCNALPVTEILLGCNALPVTEMHFTAVCTTYWTADRPSQAKLDFLDAPSPESACTASQVCTLYSTVASTNAIHCTAQHCSV